MVLLGKSGILNPQLEEEQAEGLAWATHGNHSRTEQCSVAWVIKERI
jgi:hypothetical protein